MRYIHHEIFMGAVPYTLDEMRTVFFRLDDAFAHLSGMQQNGGMGTKFDEEYQKKAEEEIKDILRDIITAFGYHTVGIEFSSRDYTADIKGKHNQRLEDQPDHTHYGYVGEWLRQEEAKRRVGEPPDPEKGDIIGIIKFDADCDRLHSIANTIFNKAPWPK